MERGRAVVVRAVDVAIPADAIEGGAPALGAFVAGALRDAGIRADRATWTVSRDRVAFKRIAIPAANSHEFPGHELPGMVRLAMLREAAVGADAAIDFSLGGADAADCWAVAVPAAEMASLRAIAGAARIAIDRVAPRTCGTAHLLAALSVDGASVAAIDLAGDSAELVVAAASGLRATRGASIADPSLEASATEARRSWTGFRLQQPDEQPASAVVIGAASTAAAVADSLGADLGVPTSALGSHPAVRCDVDPGAAWPLVGLLLESPRSASRIDLASPRRTPDLAARRRMRAYAAVALIALAYSVGWTVGRKDRSSIESRRADLREKAEGALAEHRAFKRDELRARHLDAWSAAQPTWLDSMLHLTSFAPDPSRVVLAGWNGQSMGDEVELAKDGSMRMPAGARIALDAEAADRSTADALREALVSKRDFTVRSTSTEGKAGRRLPVALELVIDSPDGPPVEQPAKASVSRRGGAR